MRVTVGDSGLCCCVCVTYLGYVFRALINSLVCWSFIFSAQPAWKVIGLPGRNTSDKECFEDHLKCLGLGAKMTQIKKNLKTKQNQQQQQKRSSIEPVLQLVYVPDCLAENACKKKLKEKTGDTIYTRPCFTPFQISNGLGGSPCE